MIRNAAGDTELSLEADFVKVADHGRPSGSPLQALNSVFPERANHKVLICADPTRFTGVNEVPSRQVVAGWRRRLRRASQLKQTSDKPEGESVVFRLG
jgi:hypothetical protein